MVARRKQADVPVNGVRAPRPVRYPESDGKPMAETPDHRDEMMRLIQTLQDAFADRDDVYVSGNMMMYFEEGNPRASISPDVFVTLGADKHTDRRVYKTWEDGPPTFVIEVTSPSTRREDMRKKRDVYARMGVQEYVLYDPLGEYLRPPLQGYQLTGGEFRPILLESGSLVSGSLNLQLVLESGRLVLYDRRTGARLLSPSEQLLATQQQVGDELAGRDALISELTEVNSQIRQLAERQAEHIGMLREQIVRMQNQIEANAAFESRVAALEEALRELTPPSAE